MTTRVTQAAAGGRPRLDALQALRAMAAAMVVWVHAFATYGEKIGALPDWGLNYSIGSLGVKLFFCISGFIIFTSSAGLSPGKASVSLFARRRLIRIVPLYWCATIIYALKLAVQGHIPGTEQFIYSLLFIPYADASGLMRPVLGQGWTLNFEMFFYVTLGVSLFFARNIRLTAVSAILLLVMFLRSAGILMASDNQFFNAIFLLADSYLLFFLAGMLIGVLADFKNTRVLATLRWEIASLTVAVLLLGFILFIPNAHLGEPGLVAVEILLCVVCVFVCVKAGGAVTAGKKMKTFGRMQSYVVLAGDGSYSTYLTHGFVMGPAARLLSATHIAVSPVIFVLCMVLVCTIVGMLIFRYFETPLLSKLNARWGRASAVREPVARAVL